VRRLEGKPDETGDVSVMSMMCNRVAWLCGCAVWLELESSAWVNKSWRCLRHEDGSGPAGTEARGEQ